MDTYIARTAMVPSSVSCDDYSAQQIADDYRGAHADGFDYADLGTLNLSGTGTIFDSIILDDSRLGTTDITKGRFTIPKNSSYYTQFRFQDTSATSSITIRDWELYQRANRAIDIRNAIN